MRVKIICGDGHIIGDDELADVEIIREIDPISINLIINICDFIYQPKAGGDYLFTAKQHIDVYYNNILHGRFYIDKITRTGENTWNIQSYDAIGILDNYRYMGGMFNNPNGPRDSSQAEILNPSMTVHEIIAEIIETASEKISYTISPQIPDEKMYGYIPVCSCREALAQICFSLGAAADTFGTTGINISHLPLAASQTVGQNRIAQNIQVNEQEKISEIKLIVDDYFRYSRPEEEKNDIYKKICKDYQIEFKTPYFLYWFEGHNSSGEMSKDPDTGKTLANANYAVININNENTSFGVYEYKLRQFAHSRKLSGSGGKTIELSGHTFVNEDNAETVLNRCEDYYSRNLKITVKIYEGSSKLRYGQAKYGQVRYGSYIYEKAVRTGEIIDMDLGYLGKKQGRVISERYNLNGNIILKECEILML